MVLRKSSTQVKSWPHINHKCGFGKNKEAQSSKIPRWCVCIIDRAADSCSLRAIATSFFIYADCGVSVRVLGLCERDQQHFYLSACMINNSPVTGHAEWKRANERDRKSWDDEQCPSVGSIDCGRRDQWSINLSTVTLYIESLVFMSPAGAKKKWCAADFSIYLAPHVLRR